jgi:opacity protein-like surface antigen
MIYCKWMTCGVIAAILLTGSAGWSQTRSAKGNSHAEGDVYGGYSVVPNSFLLGVANGWNAGVDVGTRRIAAALDFGQTFSSNSFGANSKTLTFLFGPRVWIPVARSSRIKPFADGLVGGAYASTSDFASTQELKSNAKFAFAADGGIDYSLTPRLSARLGGGYLRVHYTPSDNQLVQFFPANHARIATSVVYHF